MKPQSPLIRSQHGIEFHPVPPVHFHLPAIIDPWNPENDDPFGFDQALQYPGMHVNRMILQEIPQRFDHLVHRLVEFSFAGISRLYPLHEVINCCVHVGILSFYSPRDSLGRDSYAPLK